MTHISVLANAAFRRREYWRSSRSTVLRPKLSAATRLIAKAWRTRRWLSNICRTMQRDIGALSPYQYFMINMIYNDKDEWWSQDAIMETASATRRDRNNSKDKKNPDLEQDGADCPHLHWLAWLLGQTDAVSVKPIMHLEFSTKSSLSSRARYE